MNETGILKIIYFGHDRVEIFNRKKQNIPENWEPYYPLEHAQPLYRAKTLRLKIKFYEKILCFSLNILKLLVLIVWYHYYYINYFSYENYFKGIIHLNLLRRLRLIREQ